MFLVAWTDLIDAELYILNKLSLRLLEPIWLMILPDLAVYNLYNADTRKEAVLVIFVPETC